MTTMATVAARLPEAARAASPVWTPGANGTTTSDARTSDSNMTAPDGPATACAGALPIHVGVPLTTTTCVDTQDLLPGCGPPGTREVVFRFDAPATGNYTFRAFDAGTPNTTNSTGIVDATCTMVETCAGVLGLMVTAGTPPYVTVEASTGGCTMIDFTVN
jgi:hypothetical protein